MSLAPSTSPDTGLLLDGRYRIEDLVARGGMATVYRGRDERLDRTVALKLMHPHLAQDPALAARFTREARAAARLSHPHVVPVYDQGEDQDRAYLAMELIEGETLRTRLQREGALTARESLRITADVLSALDAAHTAGIVHRDIKPENILLAPDGRVKVADFGLARATGSGSSSTGALLGTVAYTSPEIITRGIADERSDLYAVGILLYEMLTGEQPFTGEQAVHIAFQHVHEDIPAPSSRTASVPRTLDGLVTWAAARRPGARPRDARALLAAIREQRTSLAPRVLDAPPVAREAQSTQDVPRLTASLDQAVQDIEALPRSFPSVPADTASADDTAKTDDTVVAVTDVADRADEPDESGHLVVLPLPRPRRGRHAEGRQRAGSPLARGAAAAALALSLAAAAWGGSQWYATAGPGGERTVPVLAGTPLADAESALAAEDLDARTRETYSDTVPAGHVISADPAPGTAIQRDSPVTLVVSRGEQTFAVPTVEGLPLEDARAEVDAVSLVLVEDDSAWSEDVPAGEVISQSAAAEALPEGGEVHVVVSDGPEPIHIPDVTGESTAQARSILEDRGFVVATAEAHSGSVPEGAVIAQSPTGGTGQRGDTVSMTISLGPEMVTVPDVFRQEEAAARTALEDAGFSVEVAHDKGDPVLGLVYEQSAAGGSEKPKGSTITIKVF
ncbi:MAG: Stk1 family PASTA domain-containing Ser/Thr kinase [Brachybacterium sp.]|nr:Stk1 family PASTA domain-containing Ser/Thr kinase [Brachybacterium sp.]